jgi:hypothetical protein
MYFASRRIDDERLEEMRSNDACTSVVQVGDYIMIWIDNLELILPGGYETLCVEESSRKAEGALPWVEEIDFLSDKLHHPWQKKSRLACQLCGRRFATEVHVKVLATTVMKDDRREHHGDTTLFTYRRSRLRSRQIYREPADGSYGIWHNFNFVVMDDAVKEILEEQFRKESKKYNK